LARTALTAEGSKIRIAFLFSKHFDTIVILIVYSLRATGINYAFLVLVYEY